MRWTAAEHPYDVPEAGEETIEPAKALTEALRVLGLVRPGWNAFAAMRRDRLRDNAAALEYFGTEREDLRRYLGVDTDRSVQRELNAYRKKPLPFSDF